MPQNLKTSEISLDLEDSNSPLTIWENYNVKEKVSVIGKNDFKFILQK